MIDEKRLAEIEARCKAATEGPWYPDQDVPELDCVVDKNRNIAICFITQYACGPSKYNQNFISQSRQDIPDLLSEVRRLRGELAKLLPRP